MRAAFGFRESEWRSIQNDPLRQNFFVVQLKGVEEGERPEHLVYGKETFPSLIPLQRWIERTFRSGRYSARYDRVRKALTEEWQQRKDVWHLKLTELHQDAARREQLIKNLRRYLQELATISRAHCADITDFQRNFNDQLFNVTSMMTQRGRYPRNIRKAEELLPWRDALIAEYDELNDMLNNFSLFFRARRPGSARSRRKRAACPSSSPPWSRPPRPIRTLPGITSVS